MSTVTLVMAGHEFTLSGAGLRIEVVELARATVAERVQVAAAMKSEQPETAHPFPAPAHKTAGSAPRSEGSEGANSEKTDVDRSASARPSGQDTSGAQPAGIDAGIDIERNTSGPDAKRAPHSPSDGDAIAAVTAKSRLADPSVVDPSLSDLNPQASSSRLIADSPAPVPSASGTLPVKRTVLRPHCRYPDLCAGVGAQHCHACRTAMAEAEAA